MAGRKRGGMVGTARRAGSEAQRAVKEIAASAELQRALVRARSAANALGKAAAAAGTLARVAWRTSSSHARALAGSREVLALQISARKAVRTAAAAVRSRRPKAKR